MFDALSRSVRATGVRLHDFPDGFYLNDLLWFGDGAGGKVPVARGFEIIPTDPSGLGDPGLVDLRYRLQQTLAMLGSNHRMQVRWVMDSDYRAELTAYDAETSLIEAELNRKEAAGEWLEADLFQVYHRRRLHADAWNRMLRGELQRERLHVYIGSTVHVPARGASSLADHAAAIDRIARAEARRLDDDFGGRLRGLHPDAAVRALTDADHFLRAEYFHDPMRPFVLGYSPADHFEPDESIRINTFTRQWRVPQGEPNVSYTEDNAPHAILALLTLPTHTRPIEMVEMVRHLGFHEIEVVMNVKPLDPLKVAARLEKESGEASNVVKERGNLRMGENVRIKDKNERILAYRNGDRLPYAVLYTFHLWAASTAELSRRVSALQMMVKGWRTAKAELVCLPGSVRHSYANAWPGWLCGSMEDYYLETDDINAADMMPWSSTFLGETDGAEAMFAGRRDSLVFVRTRQLNGQPRHALTIGKTGSGKTTFTNDLLMQIRHTLDFVGVCESGASLVVGSALENVKPLVISPSGSQTLNPFDSNRTPLSHDFFSFLTNFLLGRMGIGKRDGSVGEMEEVNLRRGILAKNLHAHFRQTFEAVLKHNGEFSDRLRKFCVLGVKRRSALLSRGHEVGLSDVALRIMSDLEAHDPTRQQLALDAYATVTRDEIEAFVRSADSREIMRNLAFMFFDAHTVPTMGGFVDMLENAPACEASQHDLCRRMASLLRPWCAQGGVYGVLFDGPGTVQVSGRRFHVETGQIDESATELREATNAVVAGMMMQHIKRLPRKQRKFVHFPELAELLATSGGTDMLMLLSTQIRKYNGILSAEIQQYDLLRKSPIQTTLWANCSQRYFLRQPDRDDARELSTRARLSSAHTNMVENFPAPSSAGAYFLLNVEGGPTGPAIIRSTPGLLYAAESSGEKFDSRRQVLAQYDSLARGLITEGEEAAEAAAAAKQGTGAPGSSSLERVLLANV